MARTRRIVGASLVAIGGLAAGYLQTLRPTPAYAATQCGGPIVNSLGTLNTAIADFNNGGCDTITITSGFTLTANPNRIVFGDDSTLAIIGSDVTINGVDTYRPLDVRMDSVDDTLSISHLTLSHASSSSATSPSGGALSVNNHVGDCAGLCRGEIDLDNVVFTDGYATSLLPGVIAGGAIYAQAAHLVIQDSTFERNTSSAGGALWAYVPDIRISGSTFGSNRSLYDDSSPSTGGAIYARGPLTLTDSSVVNNYAYNAGGGIFTDADVTLDHTTLSGNDAAYDSGGGIRLSGGGRLIANSSAIVDNTSAYSGAGIAALAPVILTNSYVGSNRSRSGVGGIAVYSDLELRFSTVYDDSTSTAVYPTEAEVGGHLTVIGSAIGSHFADNAWYAVLVDDTNSVTTNQGGLTFTGTGSQSVAAGSLALGPRDGTHPGQAGRTPNAASPLVTGAPVANPVPAVTTDQLGLTRVSRFTIGSRQVTLAPPTPTPADPPSAPRDPVADPGDRSASVSWKPPADSGSFPVTTYQATATPGGRTCLVVAPATTCTVTGLGNGTPYAFAVKALNGAGWGPASVASAPVTPRAPSLVLHQGVREPAGLHDRITTDGTSIGVPAGTRLTPHIKYAGQANFSNGVASIVVAADGTFDWTRLIRGDRKMAAYVSWLDLASNRVVWTRVR